MTRLRWKIQPHGPIGIVPHVDIARQASDYLTADLRASGGNRSQCLASLALELALELAKAYLQCMRFRFVGCLVAWMLVLALSLGSVAQSAMAAEMIPTVTAGAVSVPVADCDDCGGNAATPEVVCYAICTSSVDLPSPILVKVGPLPQFETFVAVSQASWHANPDPFPPRPHVLS